MRTLIALLLLAGSAVAEQLQPALTANVRFESLDGAVLTKVQPDDPFAIVVSIANRAGNDAPAGLYLNGWLRPVSSRNISCVEAARAYLATQRIPIDAIDLNGPAIGVLNAEKGLTIVDPDLNLASANIIGATHFDEIPTSITPDRFGNRFLVTLPDAAQVLSVSVFGARTKTLASDIDAKGAAIAVSDGSMWIINGEELQHFKNEVSAMAYPAEIAQTDYSNSYIALKDETRLRLISSVTGETQMLASFEQATDIVPLVSQNTPFGIAALGPENISLFYIDAPENPVVINLPENAVRLAVDPTARYLFAYSPDRTFVSIIDIARSQIAQVVGTRTPVSEISFSGRAAFLMLADQSSVGAIDLSTIAPGTHAQVREIALGNFNSKPRNEPGLLVPLPPTDEILAVHTESYTGFILRDSSTMGDAPPMTAIRLRGGIPVAAAALDRGFQEGPTGVFRTTAQIPKNKAFELVVTTGIGSLSFCMPIPGETDNMAKDPGNIKATIAGGTLGLQFVDSEGRAVQVSGELAFSSLSNGWRKYRVFATDAKGYALDEFPVQGNGPIVITVRAGEGFEFHPLLIEVPK